MSNKKKFTFLIDCLWYSLEELKELTKEELNNLIDDNKKDYLNFIF